MFRRLFFFDLVLLVVAVLAVLALSRAFPHASSFLLGTVVVLVLAIPTWLRERHHLSASFTPKGTEQINSTGIQDRAHSGTNRTSQAELRAMSGQLAATINQLEHDREQLLTILSGMVEGVIAIDETERILFANDRASRLLAFNPEAAVGKRLWEVARQPAFQEMVRKGLSSDGPHREELDWKGTGVKSLAVYVSRFPGHGIPGAVVVIHDTTELRRLERMRQDFVANVSHELKTPLAVIKSNIEALIDGAADDPDACKLFLGQAAHESDRLESLIQDLLSLARIESGEMGLEFQAIPLARAIEDCVERHSALAEVKTLTMVEKPPPDSPPDLAVWADRDALRQVMDNLVDNAIKYTPNGGRITIRWAIVGERVSYEVEDTGVGIAERDIQRVFERFYRADKSRSREIGGTGLGLAIVKHLVQLLNGEVSATSQLGKGTIFKVLLPRAKVPFPPQPIPGDHARAVDFP